MHEAHALPAAGSWCHTAPVSAARALAALEMAAAAAWCPTAAPAAGPPPVLCAPPWRAGHGQTAHVKCALTAAHLWVVTFTSLLGKRSVFLATAHARHDRRAQCVPVRQCNSGQLCSLHRGVGDGCCSMANGDCQMLAYGKLGPAVPRVPRRLCRACVSFCSSSDRSDVAR